MNRADFLKTIGLGAIEVYYQGYKLGYITAYNIALENMLYKCANLYAFVNICNSCEQANNQIAIAVYAELISPAQQLIFAMENTRADEQLDIYRQNFYQNFG